MRKVQFNVNTIRGHEVEIDGEEVYVVSVTHYAKCPPDRDRDLYDIKTPDR